MDALDFIEKWTGEKDTDGTDAVGIAIDWTKIPLLDSRVLQFTGKEAWWNQIPKFHTPIWGSYDRTTLREWLNPKRQGYEKFIQDEKEKVEFYRKNGLVYPEFCAFADEAGERGILADGSHRYIDCNYLILQGEDFNGDIEKCRLDVLCLPNLSEVLSPIDYPA